MSQDIENCAELVQRGDPDRYLTAMTAPPEHRGALFVLYAFNLEVVRAPWVTSEAMIAEMRLQWWLDILDEIYAGGEPRKHEVVTPLAALIKTHHLPKELFDALIAARRWDVYKEPHASAADLEHYLQDTTGNLIRLAVLATGGVDSDALQQYGLGAGIAALLAAVPALENAQKYPLVDGSVDGVKRLAQQGLDALSTAQKDLHQTPKSARAALRAAWLAKPVLKAAIAAPHLVAQGGLRPPEFHNKTRLLWQSLTDSY